MQNVMKCDVICGQTLLVVDVIAVVAVVVAKCHGYDRYIRVKILAGWDKSLGKHHILQNHAFFVKILHLATLGNTRVSDDTHTHTHNQMCH